MTKKQDLGGRPFTPDLFVRPKPNMRGRALLPFSKRDGFVELAPD